MNGVDGSAIGTGQEARALIRDGKWTGPTAALAPGYLQANLVVVPRSAAADFAEFCRRNPGPCPLFEALPPAHGAPVHVGSPAAIGIRDLAAPDYGDAVEIRAGEVPVFWACGVTPQAVARQARLPLMITHAPGCMFITDRRIAGPGEGDD